MVRCHHVRGMYKISLFATQCIMLFAYELIPFRYEAAGLTGATKGGRMRESFERLRVEREGAALGVSGPRGQTRPTGHARISHTGASL
jgi:hypothetical protein